MSNDGKWQIGFWVIAVLVIGSFTWTTTCYLSNRNDIQKSFEKYYDLREVANEQLLKELSQPQLKSYKDLNWYECWSYEGSS